MNHQNRVIVGSIIKIMWIELLTDEGRDTDEVMETVLVHFK